MHRCLRLYMESARVQCIEGYMEQLYLRRTTVSHGPAGKRQRVVTRALAKQLQRLGLVAPAAVRQVSRSDDLAVVTVAGEHWIEVPIANGTWIAAYRVLYCDGIPTLA